MNTPDDSIRRDIETATGGRVTNRSACRSCGAPIFWVIMPSGRKAPFDVERNAAGRPVNHFNTCPRAKEHRRTHDED